MMLLVYACKVLVFGACMLPIAFGALSTGLLFSGYTQAMARNPDETEALFNATLIGFAFVETFVFMSFILALVVYLVV